MATALYRRYRPESFAEMIGQQHVTEPLMAALRSEKIGHAYLFSGPRGCGKTTSARVLARCLNCAQGPTDTPCGKCPSCVELSRGGGGSIDVVEIDAASHGGVDDARELRERATYAPARDRYKIFIIDEAHMVTSQGFNALLKIVEEPPEYLKFIFATTEPEKVLGTIRSRTHHYPFRLIAPSIMIDYVEGLCQQEGVTVEPGVLPLLVRAGGGSARDTLSILDQLIAGSAANTVTLERATALLGYTSGELIDEVINALAAVDGAALFASVDRVVQTGQDPRRFTEDLLLRLRDLIVITAASPAAAAAVFRGVPQDELERLFAQGRLFTQAQLSAIADVVNAALNTMGGATAPRLQLELMIARALAQLSGQGAGTASNVAVAGGLAGTTVAAAAGTGAARAGAAKVGAAQAANRACEMGAASGSAVKQPGEQPPVAQNERTAVAASAADTVVQPVSAPELNVASSAAATVKTAAPGEDKQRPMGNVDTGADNSTGANAETVNAPAAPKTELKAASALRNARALLQRQMDKIVASPPSTAFLEEPAESVSRSAAQNTAAQNTASPKPVEERPAEPQAAPAGTLPAGSQPHEGASSSPQGGFTMVQPKVASETADNADKSQQKAQQVPPSGAAQLNSAAQPLSSQAVEQQTVGSQAPDLQTTDQQNSVASSATDADYNTAANLEKVQMSGDLLQELWQQILEELETGAPEAYQAVAQIVPLEIKDNILFIGLRGRAQLEAFKTAGVNALREVMYGALGVKIMFQPRSIPAAAATANTAQIAAGTSPVPQAAAVQSATPENTTVDNSPEMAPPPGSTLPTSAWAVPQAPKPVLPTAQAAQTPAAVTPQKPGNIYANSAASQTAPAATQIAPTTFVPQHAVSQNTEPVQQTHETAAPSAEITAPVHEEATPGLNHATAVATTPAAEAAPSPGAAAQTAQPQTLAADPQTNKPAQASAAPQAQPDQQQTAAQAAAPQLPEVERVGEAVIRQVFNPRVIGER